MITLTELTKRFGATTAVDRLTLSIMPGRVTGFLGPNGAGKSTTIRMTLGLDRPDSGTALIDGRPYRSFRHPLREVFPVLCPGPDSLGLAGYLALISLFTLGLGAALRSAVGTLVTVFLLLAIVPATLRLPDIGALNAIADALPGSAGLHFLRGETDAYPSAVGLVLVACWAVAALLAGLAVLRRRDA
ncbi:ATP-binding cassette domain-containing protein [Micromonospora sp. WMMD1102]|uniref:ATP-binding cassette domain-containing protein n=1 Tax=Micromonospora sp. WMMD1102 TaxID=3016105 RepID=UPI003241C98F